MIPWERTGDTVTTKIDRQEAAVLRGMVASIEEMLQARQSEAPQDELAALTGIRTGPSTTPDDPIMARLLPDFHRLDDGAGDADGAAADPSYQDSAAALRSLHEPELLDRKTGVAAVVLDTCPPGGGRVTLTVEQADAWLSAINDVRLALGTTLGVSEDMPDQLPDDDPRAPHLGVYHWLTWMQESLVAGLTGDEG